MLDEDEEEEEGERNADTLRRRNLERVEDGDVAMTAAVLTGRSGRRHRLNTARKWVVKHRLLTIDSGRASFWGDAYTVRKWTRNLRMYKIRKCVPTRRNRETNDAFQKHFYYQVHQTIQQDEMFFTNDARFSFAIFECLRWSFASRVLFETCSDWVPLYA